MPNQLKMPQAAPIVKWVGGKRQLMDEIKKRIPDQFGCYYEPFLGGGAVLFKLCPKIAVVNDMNCELMNLYQVVRDHLEELLTVLSGYQNNEKFYYRIRRLDRDKKCFNRLSLVERAARTLFLNKTCYNGLFRVNNAGEFNAPFGRYKKPKIVDEKALYAVHEYFNRANIRFYNDDYESVLLSAKKGDFVYLDPPYDILPSRLSFTHYTQKGFGRLEQIRLKSVCDSLHQRGVYFLLSNAATSLVQSLYQPYLIETVKAKRLINSDAAHRGAVDEVLVTNYG